MDGCRIAGDKKDKVFSIVRVEDEESVRGMRVSAAWWWGGQKTFCLCGSHSSESQQGFTNQEIKKSSPCYPGRGHTADPYGIDFLGLSPEILMFRLRSVCF